MLRVRRRSQAGPGYGTTTLELFFDLVFVFAVTQVSHLLLADVGWEGAWQAAFCLLVVWWAWQYTAWVTNELDPDQSIVRLLLLALMLASLVLAIAIPEAFGDRGLWFAGAYVAIQVGRHAFLTFVAAARGTLERTRAGRILAWFCVAAVFWIGGALVEDEARTALWLVALALDYGAPLAYYWIPGRPRLASGTWDVGTGHFAERFGLFVIIALGESIVLIGATTAQLDLDPATVAAFAGAFLGTAALWWLYFTSIAGLAERELAQAANRDLLARDAYAYGHVLIIAGIILTAVGDELVIAHPTDELPAAELVTVCAGPALYLLAQAFLRLRMTGGISKRRLAGALACVGVGLIGTALPALAVGFLLVAVLVGVVVADRVAAARRASRARFSGS